MKIKLLAMIAVGCVLGARAELSDEWLTVSDDTAVLRTIGTRHICIFTNSAAAASVTLKKAMSLDEYLVVGGGGAGGNSISGGGGGGGVVHSSAVEQLAADTVFTVTVGAGGIPDTGTYTSGYQGGHSILAFGGRTIAGYGGTGGGGYSGAVRTAAVTGEVGSGGGSARNYSIGEEGTAWNSAQGNPGWKCTQGDVGGGGGGAGSAPDIDHGGEGLEFAISGYPVVYGSGGGAGLRSGEYLGFGGKGGTNAGNGGIANDILATPGTDGTGGGGGGGGHDNMTARRGAVGGSGTVILVLSECAATVSRFGLGPIADQLFEGEAVTPAVVVTNELGTVLAEGTDYTVEYTDNAAVGIGLAIAKGAAGSDYEGYTAVRSFAIHGVAFEDDNLVASDNSICKTVVGVRQVYVFTNTTETVVVRTKRMLTRDDGLLVGGGGSGGGIYGGGGGGGGYVTASEMTVFNAGSEIRLKVGAGAEPHPAKGNHGARGCIGGHTWADFGAGAVYAYGGGGGGGYNSAAPIAAVYNEIGSGGGDGNSGVVGERWNSAQGHMGAPTYGGNSRGGGGSAMCDAVIVAGKGTVGAEGMTNAITGVDVVYASGGGGCPNNACKISFGGTNAGDGRASGELMWGGEGVDGTGSGGGGGGSGDWGSGGRGGSGTVILSFLVGDRVNGRFTVDPIEDQIYYGKPVKPAVRVVNPSDETLTEGVDYVTEYENFDGAGTARVTVSGKSGTIFDGYFEVVEYRIHLPAYADDLIFVDDGSVQCIERGSKVVYVFTNSVAAQTVILRRPARLARVLAVGGGGSGGTVIGGGGGGGGVVYSNRVNIAFERDAEFVIKVGEGAEPVPAGNTGNARYPAGLQGGRSTFSGGGISLVAYGGSGGSGFANLPLGDANGEIGSGGGGANGASIGTQGVNWNQGHSGGGSNSNFGGGGGGAATQGTTGASGGTGGEGVVCDITGENVVYGSGGGGGARGSERTPGQGGTNAGDGNNDEVGYPAPDGFGGGGGGAGYTTINYMGGKGGTGTVIIELRPRVGGTLRVS